MSVFNSVTHDAKRCGYNYYVQDDYLRDMQRYTREGCYVLDVIDSMMSKYPSSGNTLLSIRNRIENIVNDSLVDAEDLIEVRGMNKILYDLCNIVKN